MKDLRFFNYKSAKTNMTADKIPTMIPAEAMKAIAGDQDERDWFFKVESIDYPVEGSGGTYEERFFDSFVAVMNERPIPGSKRGHTWESRPTSDLYTVGALMEKKGNGKGTVHFKVFIPQEGDGESNAALIRDAKANIVHFSLVTYPEVEYDQDGKSHFVGSLGYERNDAVEYNAGAMKQTVNSADIKTELEIAKELVIAGSFDAVSDIKEGSCIQNGKVIRSVLRRRVSNASCENKPEIAELLSLIDTKHKEANKMDKSAVLEWLKTNNGIPVAEIHAAMGVQIALKTEAEAKLLNSLAEAKIADPLAEIAVLRGKLDAVEAERKKNMLDKEFGVDGDLRDYAGKMLNSVPLDKMENQIAELKKDSIALKLAGEKADIWSNSNVQHEQSGAEKDALAKFR